jgi:FAD/FMN-containing dehydrogenase
LKATALAKLYPQWEAFLSLRNRLDPDTKFLNNYLREVLGGAHGKAT